MRSAIEIIEEIRTHAAEADGAMFDLLEESEKQLSATNGEVCDPDKIDRFSRTMAAEVSTIKDLAYELKKAMAAAPGAV